MAKTKKATAKAVVTKTWGWGVQAPNGKLWRDVYSTKQDAKGSYEWNDNAEQFKVVKVWIVPVK